MTYRTPLRYPGGKAKLSDFIKRIISSNNLLGTNYVEPFAGGAGIALELLFSGCVKRIYLNDYDKSIFAFWRAILERNEDFCSKILETPITVEEWTKQKEIIQNPDLHSFFDLGFSTFFLNRTNRSGIILAGIIGGKKQTGKWKIDARFNKSDLVKRIQNIGLLAGKINLSQSDAKIFLRNLEKSVKDKSFVYLDPPYYIKGEGLYEHHFKDKDHKDLFREVTKGYLPHWIVSYDNEPFISDLYSNYRNIVYSLNYSASSPALGKEIVFFSDSLRIPEDFVRVGKKANSRIVKQVDLSLFDQISPNLPLNSSR